MRSIFLYRYSKDSQIKNLFLFYDEFGISSCAKNKKMLLHKDEHNLLRKIKGFKRLNVQMLCSFEKVLAIKINNHHTKMNTVTDFIIDFFESNKEFKSKNVTLVQDNASYHFEQKLINYLDKNIGRLLYISPNSPEQNFIELVIGNIKKRLKDNNKKVE